MSEFIIFMYVIISIISAVLFCMLSIRFFKGSKKFIVTKLTKVILIMLFFIFLDGFCNSLTYFLGITSHTIFYSNEIVQIISKFGIFVSIVLLAHLVYSGKFEELKKKEISVLELQVLNKELGNKTREMEVSQEKQEKKLKELERFNEIAKQREMKMRSLIKKIDKLESKLKK